MNIEKLTYTRGERTLAALALVISGPAALNWALWNHPLLGLSAKKIAILAAIPLLLIVYYLRSRADARSFK